MAKRAAKQDDDRRARAAEEARSHGGLVALRGSLSGTRGPSDGHWHWRDEYLNADPTCWYRAGYVETAELAENLNLVVNGVNLRWYGLGVVWRFDPSLVESAALVDPTVPLWKSRPTSCACGERLLLLAEGRTQCERCRLGTTGPVLLWSTTLSRTEDDLDVWPEIPLPDADLESELAEPAVSPEPPVPLEPPGPPAPTSAEVADWVWQRLAPLYDR